jgi:hypothetical protein
MGEPKKPAPPGPVAKTFGFAVVLGGMWLAYRFIDERIHAQAAVEMGGIERKVAEDAVTQYGIAKRGGAPMDVCAQAGMVAAAFLQAKDEANYRVWKATEATDCAAAGMPAP